MEAVGLRDYATDAIRWWEPRRIAYNAVLAAIVCGYGMKYLTTARRLLTVDDLFGLAVLVVLANMLYCTAYIVDIFVQMSGYRESWRRWRWALFAIGMCLAAILTRWISLAVLEGRT